ncbi:UPF0481 protein At3g47200 [Quercus suber]
MDELIERDHIPISYNRPNHHAAYDDSPRIRHKLPRSKVQVIKKLHDEWMDEKFEATQKCSLIKTNLTISKGISLLTLSRKTSHGLIRELEPIPELTKDVYLQSTLLFESMERTRCGRSKRVRGRSWRTRLLWTNILTDDLSIIKDDPIFNKFSMKKFLLHDLILLENQVPWMVLTRLFNLTTGPEHRYPLSELAINYFNSIFSLSPPYIHSTCIEDIKHIPDVLRKWMISSIHEEVEGSPLSSETIPSATSLDESGIKLIMRESRSILDIKFDKGVLEIPPLLINDTTEAAFRNLISFEQCYPKCPARSTSYAIFIDRLINSAKDAELLGKYKIVENWLSPDDAAQLFNKLYLNNNVNENYYQSLSRDLNSYCNQRWPRWRAGLVRNYFNTPWAILSTIATAMLLILAFVQTWYTVI